MEKHFTCDAAFESEVILYAEKIRNRELGDSIQQAMHVYFIGDV
jgi:hypothetical protein